jgi:hypothetical protein
MAADASPGSSSGEVGSRSSPPWWMSVWAVWPLAAGGLFLPWTRWAPDLLWLAAPFAGLAGAGVAAGITLLWHDRPVLGWIGVTNWVAPIVGHHMSLAMVRGWWAPSMPGDLLGLLASVVMATVAIAAALVGWRRRRRAGRTIPVAALALLVAAAAGCGGDVSAAVDPSPTTPPATAVAATTTVPPAPTTVATTSPQATTTASGPPGAWVPRRVAG